LRKIVDGFLNAFTSRNFWTPLKNFARSIDNRFALLGIIAWEWPEFNL